MMLQVTNRVLRERITRATKVGRHALWMSLLLGQLLKSEAADSENHQSPSVLTTISQLRHASESNQSIPREVRLEGSVLWANPNRTEFIFQDASGGIRVNMDLQSQPPLQIGQKVLLEGRGLLTGDNFSETFINNDGLHPISGKSQSLYLTEGRHPIRLDWFNGPGLFGLDVSYQGPNFPLRPIPESALYRITRTENGTTNWAHGLNYASYEGSWQQLPNLNGLTNYTSGVTSNFNLSMRPRDTEVALRFDGYIEIPQAGLYTFRIASDDGSRLFIDDSSLRLTQEDKSHLPMAQRIFAAQPLPFGHDCQWSFIDGTVTYVAQRPNALDLELNSGAGVMYLHLMDASPKYSQLLLNSKIRATGVSQSTFASDGQRIGGTLLVPGIQQIEILDPAPALWNSAPVTTLQSLEHSNALLNAGTPVHLLGTVRATGPGNSILLDDASGQLLVEANQTFSNAVGNHAEILGFLQRNETNVSLIFGATRLVRPATNGISPLPLLTKIAQVKSLTQDQARKGYPVKIQGIITASFGPGFFIQDGTWAIYVRTEGLLLPEAPRTGDYWEIEGSTYVAFSPNIQAERAARLGPGVMPEPIRPTPDQFANGSLDTRYIEIQGVVTDTGFQTMELLTPEGRIHVRLSDVDPALGGSPENNFSQYVNASIRIRGCAIPSRDETTQQIDLGNSLVWICNYTITVDKPAPADLFSAPQKSIADLRRFNPHASTLERVKVAGQILHHQGNESFLSDGTNSLRFISRQSAHPQPGDTIEVVGFPDWGGPSLLLLEASSRLTGHAPLPPPVPISSELLTNHNYEGRLIRIRARLTDMSTTESSNKVFVLQAGARGFVARLNGPQEMPPDLRPGSQVEISGLYVSQGNIPSAPSNAASFELLLNSVKDITVLDHPSWWTFQRILTAFGIIMAVLIGALLWIFTLKRQVNSQALMIRQKVEREVTLEERARIARDIHDTLEQALAGTSLQLNALADSMHGMPQEPQRILKVARLMINHAQDEARRTVRNLRLLDLEKHSLPTALSQFATVSENDSQTKITVTVTGQYTPLPNPVENHLLRIGQEAVTNAMKHSGAKTLQIKLDCEVGWLNLSIEDDGCGFDLGNAAGASSGHFGLLGMRERAEKIGATLQVASNVGHGTKVTVKLPASEQNGSNLNAAWSPESEVSGMNQK